VADADLPTLYRRADALVFPSLYEGFGLPVLEAMACGIPVIASNAGSLPEVAGDAALMIDPTDRDGLARAIAQVLGNPALHADLACRGVQRAAQFSWHETARRTLAVYQDVLNEAGPRTVRAYGRHRYHATSREHVSHHAMPGVTEEVEP
jgi:alpha-1,3-rhamnosyl/mannosyltransferase